jgi:hypothetical protein
MIRKLFCISVGLYLLILPACESNEPEDKEDGSPILTFYVTADMRNYSGENPDYFRGTCEKIDSLGEGDFMVSPGDIDPPWTVYGNIEDYIGEDYVWYPVIGNHEAETPDDMTWLRDFNAGGNTLPNIVNVGPVGSEETTYSFDYGFIHFVCLNQYFDGVSDVGSTGDVEDELHDWLVADLAATSQRVILVFGHEPAYPMPDEESGRLRHEYDSLNQYPANRDRFWETLKSYGVAAYICGHTHNYSSEIINGLLQIDAGHARGTGDTGARSTFLKFEVYRDGFIMFEAYRLNLDRGIYELTDAVVVNR